MSIPVPLHGFGSGGAPLNFKIVSYATQETLLAARPAENTIGIVTTVKIPSWLFSPSEPSSAEPGMVWIKTGGSGPREINALKKNGIIIYPLSASQYVGGTWESVTAMSYQRGKWETWITYLYNHGDECTHLTGGWTATALKSSQHTTVSAKAPTITRNGDSIKAAVSSGGGVFHCEDKIDLTDFNTLTIRGTFTRTGEQSRNLMAGCWKEFGSYYDDGNGVADAYAKLEGSSGTELVVDVSTLSGFYIVGIGITSSTAEVTEALLT